MIATANQQGVYIRVWLLHVPVAVLDAIGQYVIR